MSKSMYSCLHCMKLVTALDEVRKVLIPHWESQEGAPSPLGVSWIVPEQAWNFALYSKHATRVTLLLYSGDTLSQPQFTFEFHERCNKSGPVWHCRIPRSECPKAEYYAYRIDGPAPAAGFDWHAFDSDKLLLDPYARSVFFPPSFDREAAIRPGPNEGRAPLGLLNVCQCERLERPKIRHRHGADLIIYELHVKGFTRNPNSGVTADRHGTFSGLIDKIPYLTELGVTAVELMPVFQFDPNDRNYWGYMPLNFFSPHQDYSADPKACQQQSDFREMVDALHDAGIEVILDVVYNHTCEGDHRGPTYSFKGIDNSTYYLVNGDSRAPYSNFSGTGNTLRTAHHAVRRLILDSLRHWVTEMGADGFRFDLASIFTRTSDGRINPDDSPIFGQIASDPALAETRMIAEPWDAAGAYQLGRAFPGIQWHQWNSRYRDTLQRFVRGDRGMTPELMTRLYGSTDLFPDDRMHAFRPFQSINYVTSHDGFTLYDLVSFNHKHNEANGHGNSDGHDDYRWNCGWEGDEDVPDEVLRLRKQQARNFFCLLMLSNGTPMFRMGDEFLQSQSGNNNPYNQDNETTWLNWDRLSEQQDMFCFVRDMIAFRKTHPSICRSRFWRDDVSWFGPAGPVDMSEASQTLAFFLRRLSADEEDIYTMINSSDGRVRFDIRVSGATNWSCRIDTSVNDHNGVERVAAPLKLSDEYFDVQPRSVLVLTRP